MLFSALDPRLSQVMFGRLAEAEDHLRHPLPQRAVVDAPAGMPATGARPLPQAA